MQRARAYEWEKSFEVERNPKIFRLAAGFGGVTAAWMLCRTDRRLNSRRVGYEVHIYATAIQQQSRIRQVNFWSREQGLQ